MGKPGQVYVCVCVCVCVCACVCVCVCVYMHTWNIICVQSLWSFRSRYNQHSILAGAGTVGIEMVEQMREKNTQIDAVIVPVGGGGLIAGISTAVKTLSPTTVVYVSADVLAILSEVICMSFNVLGCRV